MQKNIKVLKFFIVMCCIIVFVIFCVFMFSALNEKEPGTYDKIKYFNKKITDVATQPFLKRLQLR